MKKLIVVLALIVALTCANALATEVNVEDIPANYAFTLDSIEVQLPAPMSLLLENGWSFSDFAKDAKLPAMSFDSVSVYREDMTSITVTIVNATDEEKPLGECSLAGVMLFAADNIPFEMPNGITMASTRDEVYKAFGLNGADILAAYAEGSVGFSLKFYPIGDDGIHTDAGIGHVSVGMNQIDFNFDKPLSENGVIESIQLRYMDGSEPEEEEENAAAQ